MGVIVCYVDLISENSIFVNGQELPVSVLRKNELVYQNPISNLSKRNCAKIYNTKKAYLYQLRVHLYSFERTGRAIVS